MVMGFVWVGMLIISVIACLVKQDLGVLTPSTLEGAASAVTLSLIHI